MKKNISNFGNTVLSREQMKEVTGGQVESCVICSSGANGGACGTATFSGSVANDMAIEFNGFNDGYFYYAKCSGPF